MTSLYCTNGRSVININFMLSKRKKEGVVKTFKIAPDIIYFTSTFVLLLLILFTFDNPWTDEYLDQRINNLFHLNQSFINLTFKDLCLIFNIIGVLFSIYVPSQLKWLMAPFIVLNILFIYNLHIFI